MAVPDLNTLGQMAQIQDRFELEEAWLPGRVGDLLERDSRGHKTVLKSSMDKGGSSCLHSAVSWVMDVEHRPGLTV